MAFTNDLLLRTVQFIKSAYSDEEIRSKSFLMLGKQEMHLHEAMLTVLEEAGLIADTHKFGDKELEDSVFFLRHWDLRKFMLWMFQITNMRTLFLI